MSLAKMGDVLKEIQMDMQLSRDEARAGNDKILSVLSDFKSRINNLEEKVETFDILYKSVPSDMQAIYSDLNALKQKSIVLNLVVKGIPELPTETPDSINHIISQVLQLLSVSIVFKAKRIGKKSNNLVRLILLSVNNLTDKASILAASKSHKITASMITVDNNPLGTSSDMIYLDEHLTPYTVHLLKKARELKQIGVKYVWSKNGIVLVRSSDNSAPVIIRSERDISSFKLNNRKRKHDGSDVAAIHKETINNNRDVHQPDKLSKTTDCPTSIVTRSMAMHLS